MLSTKPTTNDKGGSYEKNDMFFIVRTVFKHFYDGGYHGRKNGRNKG